MSDAYGHCSGAYQQGGRLRVSLDMLFPAKYWRSHTSVSLQRRHLRMRSNPSWTHPLRLCWRRGLAGSLRGTAGNCGCGPLMEKSSMMLSPSGTLCCSCWGCMVRVFLARRELPSGLGRGDTQSICGSQYFDVS